MPLHLLIFLPTSKCVKSDPFDPFLTPLSCVNVVAYACAIEWGSVKWWGGWWW